MFILHSLRQELQRLEQERLTRSQELLQLRALYSNAKRSEAEASRLREEYNAILTECTQLKTDHNELKLQHMQSQGFDSAALYPFWINKNSRKSILKFLIN